MAKEFNPRTQKKIQNLSRAINKINKTLDLPENSTIGVGIEINNIKMGINDFTYQKGDKTYKVRYDQVSTLGREEQAALRLNMTKDRYELRQQRAVEIIKEKGKVSAQFKRSLEADNELLRNIKQFEEQFNDKEQVKSKMSKARTVFDENWMDESDEYFSEDSDKINEFFDVYGTKTGFSQLNQFTWNVFKMVKGI